MSEPSSPRDLAEWKRALDAIAGPPAWSWTFAEACRGLADAISGSGLAASIPTFVAHIEGWRTQFIALAETR